MKTRFLATLTILALCTSCSDNLSNSKAESIISECLEKAPEQRTVSFTLGKATFRDTEYDRKLLEKYRTLVEGGYLEMELINEVKSGYRKRKEFEIKLTEKALEFMEKVPEDGGTARAKSHKYIVDEVLEVQEIPARNSARAKVRFVSEEVTPFAVLNAKEINEFWMEDLEMNKTSNGWKYCDNF